MKVCEKCGSEHKSECYIDILDNLQDSKIIDIEGKEKWIEYIGSSERRILTRKPKKYGKPTSFTVFFDKKKETQGRIEYFLKGELVAILNKQKAESELWDGLDG